MNRRQTKSLGITLIEMMAVLVMIAILAGMMLTSSSPTVTKQLKAVAQVIASDVAYCNSLARTYNSKYKITFERDSNSYWISHSGTNSTLDNLPVTAFRSSSDSATQQTTLLDEIPANAGNVRIIGVIISSTPKSATNQLEFGPYGETTSADETVIWLQGSNGEHSRYFSITINPITGITKFGNLLSALPGDVAAVEPFEAVVPPEEEEEEEEEDEEEEDEEEEEEEEEDD